jgi:WD40 repeat protein
MSKVFLSHSSRDSVQARALMSWLEKAEPALIDEIFLDLDVKNGIPAGMPWKEALRKANDRCEAVICLVSKNWDSSYECKTEYRTAEDRGKPIFPVRLEPTSGQDITSEWQRCDLFGDGPKIVVPVDGTAVEFLADGLERLQRGLRATGIAPDTFIWPPPGDPDRSPYRGWQPLDAVDAAVYFGRDAEINRALTTIRALRISREKNTLSILGPSGVGKSSFLRAGLLPRLQLDDRHFLTMGIVRPERHPLTGDFGLAKSIYALRSSLGLNEPDLGVIKAGVDDPGLVRGWLAEAQSASMQRFVNGVPPTAPTVILPVDQAEELFGADVGAEASGFLAIVADLLTDDTSGLHVMMVATIRSDRYELFQTEPELQKVDAYLFEDLKPMRPDRFREVICGPAGRLEAAGTKLQWDPDVVERLIQACDASSNALPLLSLTLENLHEDYGGDGEITLAEYESMGGMGRVVENVVDNVLSTDADTRHRELEQLRHAFIPWLATINPANDHPLRRVARWFDLPADSHRLIDALVAKRLLVKDERDGEVVVEVALESLLGQWDALAGWLREDAPALKEADVLDQAALAWADNGFKDDWLLPGDRLTDAEALAAKRGFRSRLNAAREYLHASRQQEDRRARKRQEDAEALAAAEQRAKQDAEKLAETERRAKQDAEKLAETERRAKQDAEHRSRVLRRVLVLTVVVALVAVVSAVWAWKAKNEAWKATNDAHEQFLDATAQRLRADSRAILAGQSPEGNDDVRAMQLLLAARSIRPNLDANKADYQLLSVLNEQRDLVKIWDTPARVFGAVVSPLGRRILAGSADKTIKLWDPATGEQIGELRGHDDQVTSVAFSPDGTLIASGSKDKTVRIWDAARHTEIGTLRGHEGAVTSVAFSRDGTRIASGSIDETVRIWDAVQRKQITELRGHTRMVSGVAFSPDGNLIASGSADTTVRLWDVAQRKKIAELRGHQDAVVGVAFSPDGKRIASGSTDRTVRLWDVARHTQVAELDGHQGPVLSVAFSPDGTRIASGSDDKTIRLWDAATEQPIGAPLTGHDCQVLSVAFSPDSLQVVSAGDDDTVRLWDASSWQPRLGHQDAVQYAVFRADARRIVAASGDDNTVRSWDTVTGRPIGTPVRLEGSPPPLFIAMDSGHLTADVTGPVQLWDTAPIRGRQFRLAPTPIGKPLSAPMHLIAYSPAGKIAAAVAADTIQLYEADTMRRLGDPIKLGHPVTAIALTPDGRVIATGEADSTVRLWNADTGTPRGSPMKGDGPVSELTFGADGHTLVAWGGGRTLQLWNTETSQPIDDPMRTDAAITALAFSFDGRMVAAGDQDGVTQLWDIHDIHHPKPLPKLVGQNGKVTSLEFSPDGSKILSASTNGTVRVWPIETPSPTALCDKLTTNMSPQRWDSWVSSDIPYRDVCTGLAAEGTGHAT